MSVIGAILEASAQSAMERGYFSSSSVRLPSFMYRAAAKEIAGAMGYNPSAGNWPTGGFNLGSMYVTDACDGT